MILCNPDYYVYATLYTRDERGLLHSNEAKEQAVQVLLETKRLFRLSIAAYVVMNDRVDWLFSSPRGNKCAAISHVFKEGILHICQQSLTDESEAPIWICGIKKIARRGSLELRHQLDSIHAEPVRTGLTERAADYPWSSFPSRVGKGLYSPDWDRRDMNKRKYFNARLKHAKHRLVRVRYASLCSQLERSDDISPAGTDAS